MKKTKLPHYGLRFYFTLIATATILISVVVAAGLNYSIFRKLYTTTTLSFFALLLFACIVGTILAYFVGKLYLAPIIRLRTAMERVSKGDYTQHLEEKGSIREVRQLYSSFNTMVCELKATEILQTDFVSNVSHEFKTPISSISGFATLLQDKNLTSGEREDYIQKILFNSQLLSELVGNILLLSKLENKSIPVNGAEFRLDEQIRKVILAQERDWEAKGIELEIELDDIVYDGPEGIIFYAWSNLLNNAIKYAGENGVVRIELHREERGIIFTIEDDGPGIPAEERTRVFNKFYQIDNSHGTGGNGLGLALVMRIVELMGAEIGVTDSVLGGAKFTVTIP